MSSRLTEVNSLEYTLFFESIKMFVGQGFQLPNEWNIIHSVALNEDAQLLCGADRDNFRIQCFHSNTGEFRRQIRVHKKETVGPIYAIDFVPNTNSWS